MIEKIKAETVDRFSCELIKDKKNYVIKINENTIVFSNNQSKIHREYLRVVRVLKYGESLSIKTHEYIMYIYAYLRKHESENEPYLRVFYDLCARYVEWLADRYPYLKENFGIKIAPGDREKDKAHQVMELIESMVKV